MKEPTLQDLTAKLDKDIQQAQELMASATSFREAILILGKIILAEITEELKPASKPRPKKAKKLGRKKLGVAALVAKAAKSPDCPTPFSISDLRRLQPRLNGVPYVKIYVALKTKAYTKVGTGRFSRAGY